MSYKITIIGFDGDSVRYRFTSGTTGKCSRKWFPGGDVGQVWKMTCVGALIMSCVLER